ncbi:hypothetical protein PR002_g18114 [Phytophthora rubi]|uniref:Uncharacterized protein n=1 Tax=Phytophthora rubi TaxID=129364 RepID=A0A6A3JZH7_9STRA|nr:hypothetical protein PR002_g18114 [Phytophthora rubi]
MAKKKMTTGSGSKQRSVKERPGSAGAGTKSSLQAKAGRDDEDSAAVAHAAQQERAAHARSVKAQKLLRRREVLELRQR